MLRRSLIPAGATLFRWRSLVSWPGVIVPVLVVVAGGALAAWTGLRPGAPAVSYRLVPAVMTTLRQTVPLTGMIEHAATATLSFSAPGQVTAVDVKAGQHVRRGQLLAAMSSPALQETAVQADATLAQDRVSLAQDEAGDASSAQINADQALVAADQSQADSADAALRGARLVAPAAGIVTAVGYTAGEQVDGGTGPGAGGSGGSGGGGGKAAGSITVVSSRDIVNAQVHASMVSQIKAGEQVLITPEGGGPVVQGVIASISLQASTSTGVAMYPVVIDVTGKPAGLFAGASASVSVISRQVRNILAVPTAALGAGRDGRSTVRVMAGGRQVTREVTTGLTAEGLTQVTSGLSAGDEVVVRNVAIQGGPGQGGAGGISVFPGGQGAISGPGGG